LLAAHRNVKELVEIGAYAAGSDADADAALALVPQINAFLQQGMGEPSGDTWAALNALVGTP
jgi:flagellum-specific ATP synthase